MTKNIDEKTCKKLYDMIHNYPKASLPIRYPKSSSKFGTTFHDLISANINELVPNIDMAIHSGYQHNDIENWVKKTIEYVNALNTSIQNKCDTQMTKLNLIKQHEIRSKELDMKRVDNLPDDLIRYIHEFLLPETRIQLLLTRYPTYLLSLNKITCFNLKKYLGCVYKHYVKHPLCYNPKFPERHTCIQNYPGFRLNFTKKEDGINQLIQIFNALQTAIPKTPQFRRYYQKKTLKFLQSLIFISIHKINRVKHNYSKK
jgi:hypothetical protein